MVLQRVPGGSTLRGITRILGYTPATRQIPAAKLVAVLSQCVAVAPNSVVLAPGTRTVGGRALPGRSPKVASRVAQALRMAAMSARRSQTFIGVRHRARPARKDSPVAVTAPARELACLACTMVTRGRNTWSGAWRNTGDGA